MVDFRDKTVVVTGGGRGIGRAVLNSFARLGPRIAFCGRSQGELEKASNDLEALNPGRVFFAACDVGRPDQVKAFIAAVYAKYGQIDVLVHNAGMARFNSVGLLSDEDWTEVINTNLNGTFHVFREGFNRMKENRTSPKGQIMTIGSLSHRLYEEGSAAYATTKAAQKVLADYLFEESRQNGIIATYLAIGSANTTMSARNPDTGWKIQPNDIGEAVVKFADIAFSSPSLCVSYAELRVKRPLRTEGRKE